MLVILCVCLVLLLTTTPTDSAPAPFTVEALLTAKLLGLAGLKGNFCFKIYFAQFYLHILGYLIGNALASRSRSG